MVPTVEPRPHDLFDPVLIDVALRHLGDRYRPERSRRHVVVPDEHRAGVRHDAFLSAADRAALDRRWRAAHRVHDIDPPGKGADEVADLAAMQLHGPLRDVDAATDRPPPPHVFDPHPPATRPQLPRLP